MPYKLSPSSLNLFKECQRCFWLEKNKMWKRPLGIFPSLPSGMDKVLKEYFDKFRDMGILPSELCNHCGSENMILFGSNDKEKDLLKIWRNNLKGLRWTDSEGNIFFGAVDSLLKSGCKLVVLDFKTRGFPLKEDTAKTYQNQIDSYGFLLQMNGYEIEDFGFLLFYFPSHILDSGQFIFSTELVKIQLNSSNAERLFKDAINLLKSFCPEKRCDWCGKVDVKS